MALVRPLSGGEGPAADAAELRPESLPLGTTTPGSPGDPSWTSRNPCLDGTRGVVELAGLAVAGGCELATERCCALDELPMSTRLPQPGCYLPGYKQSA